MPRHMVMLRTEKGFVPADAVSAEELARIKRGKPVAVTVVEKRNLQHHRKLFALLQVIHENMPEPRPYQTLDDLLEALKIATGHFKTWKQDGKTVVSPKSISFEKMDQAQFEAFYDAVVNVVLTKVLPNARKEDLERMVYEILDGRSYA